MEFFILVAIVIFTLSYNNIFSVNKFVKDNEVYFKGLKEKDYEFFARSKYGDDILIEDLFQQRLKIGLIGLVFTLFFFIFTSNMNFLNVVAAFILAFGLFKLNYISVKRYYKAHLEEIDVMLPYYLKSVEVLIQHYTIPVALGKSIDRAPEIFKDGLRDMVEKINAGDSTIDPYMEFAEQYPVRDSMRMMRLLYRLGIGAQEDKHEQLLLFSRTVSNLQNKARDHKYKERLKNMQSRTMYMLVVTGGGVIVLLVLSMTIFLSL
jgi:hypothetical protein